MIEVVFEQSEISELRGHSFADVDICDGCLLVELWVVHWKIDWLPVVHDGNQLGSGQIRLVVLNHQQVPLIDLDICDFHSIALHRGWAVISWQDSVYDLIAGIKIAFKPSIPFRKAIE